MVRCYNFLSHLLYFFYRFLVIPLRIKKGKEAPFRVKEKLGFTKVPRPIGTVIWFHAASVGESLSVLKLIQEIQKRFPNIHILLTSSTKTSAQMIAQRFPKTVIHQYAPLDFMPCVRRFLHHWKPDGVCWIESELWPNTITQLQKSAVSAVLINMRLSEVSLKRWQMVPKAFKYLLGSFELILTQTQKLAGTLQTIGCKNVLFKGNLKYVSDVPEFSQALVKRLQQEVSNRPVWLATSTHPGEEKILIQSHHELKQHLPDALLVLAPRHPHRTQDLKGILQESKMSFVSYSSWSQGQSLNNEDCLLVDQMGVLPLFYALCPVTFVGGTLVPHIGGHNMIEPLRQGSIPIFGPLYGNFIEIASEMLASGIALRVQKPIELSPLLHHLLTSQELQNLYRAKQKSFLLEKQAILDRIIEVLSPLLQGRETIPKAVPLPAGSKVLSTKEGPL